MTRLEEIRLRKLKGMIEWRMRPDANSHQTAELEALIWAVDFIDSFFGEDTIHDCDPRSERCWC